MQKQEQIVEMFNQIAPTYDKANRILSFGVDTSWRIKGISWVLTHYPHDTLNIVDVACGTGDMIALWQKKATEFHKKIQSIRGVDPSSAMLEVARSKFPKLEFIKAYAQALPLADESTDIISISYGIRNVMQRKEALSEFARVLKKGGFLLILEFTKRDKGGLVSWCRDFYLKNILPKLGGFISKNTKAYEYLPSSIEGFLNKDELMSELSEAGFENVEFKSFSFGVSSMFVAMKK